MGTHQRVTHQIVAGAAVAAALGLATVTGAVAAARPPGTPDTPRSAPPRSFVLDPPEPFGSAPDAVADAYARSCAAALDDLAWDPPHLDTDPGQLLSTSPGCHLAWDGHRGELSWSASPLPRLVT